MKKHVNDKNNDDKNKNYVLIVKFIDLIIWKLKKNSSNDFSENIEEKIVLKNRKTKTKKMKKRKTTWSKLTINVIFNCDKKN